MKLIKGITLLASVLLVGHARAEFINHALSGTAVQVGVFYNQGPDRAIDGDTSTSAMAVGSTIGWWELELDQDYFLGSIRITRDLDDLGFKTYMGDSGDHAWGGTDITVYDSNMIQIGSTFNVPETGTQPSYILTNGGAGYTDARHIRVERVSGDAANNLWISEVEAYTEVIPEPGTVSLMGLGSVGLLYSRRLRRRRRRPGSSMVPVAANRRLDHFVPESKPSVDLEKQLRKRMVVLCQKVEAVVQICRKFALDRLDAFLAGIMK